MRSAQIFDDESTETDPKASLADPVFELHRPPLVSVTAREPAGRGHENDRAYAEEGAELMLTLTENAAQAITTIVDSSELPTGSGMRIATGEPTTDGEASLELTLSEAPGENDAIVQEQGSRVFLDQQAATFLDDKILDAEVAEDRVRFSINEQPPPA